MQVEEGGGVVEPTGGLGRLGWGYERGGGGSIEGEEGEVTDEVPIGFIHQTWLAE